MAASPAGVNPWLALLPVGCSTGFPGISAGFYGAGRKAQAEKTSHLRCRMLESAASYVSASAFRDGEFVPAHAAIDEDALNHLNQSERRDT
ncbi:MAG: hypothetical protein JWQ95_1954 [Sphaerisporangium sp.]|jgi:hypothetical protein|nr:hypothetical protein [Sphaerisporangium sp.]